MIDQIVVMKKHGPNLENISHAVLRLGNSLIIVTLLKASSYSFIHSFIHSVDQSRLIVEIWVILSYAHDIHGKISSFAGFERGSRQRFPCPCRRRLAIQVEEEAAQVGFESLRADQKKRQRPPPAASAFRLFLALVVSNPKRSPPRRVNVVVVTVGQNNQEYRLEY